jgi:hypothetical protein
MQTFTAGGIHFQPYNFTGLVAEAGKNMETKVSGSGGGGGMYNGTGGTAPVTITSHTIIHDQIFLIDEKGSESSFQLQGFNVACRKDNKLSVIWVIKQGGKTGPYVSVVNHTTGNVFFNDSAINGIFKLRRLLLFLAILVVSIIAGNITSFGVGMLVFIAGIVYMYMSHKKTVQNFKTAIAVN